MTSRSGSVWRSTLWSAAVAWLAIAALFAVSVAAQQNEQAVRAAYVFNLTKYVSWPGTRDHIVIGVFGDGATALALKQVLDGKKSDGRPIRVILHSSDAQLTECDVLYVSGASPASLKSILNRTNGRPVLIVGDSDRFVRNGGMVGLVRTGDQIQIEVNLETLRNRGLDISSRLLRIAVIVSGDGGNR